MAPALQFLSPPTPFPLRNSRQIFPATVVTNCSSNPNPTPSEPPNPSTFEMERRRKSVITPEERRSWEIQRGEPPNFEIGWKRTKEIKHEKPKGWEIADFLEKLETLMSRGSYGSGEMLAKVAGVVAERAREEAELLRDRGAVDERMVTELFRVLVLIEMDVVMVKAAVKPETLKERIEQAKVPSAGKMAI